MHRQDKDRIKAQFLEFKKNLDKHMNRRSLQVVYDENEEEEEERCVAKRGLNHRPLISNV